MIKRVPTVLYFRGSMNNSYADWVVDSNIEIGSMMLKIGVKTGISIGFYAGDDEFQHKHIDRGCDFARDHRC